MDGTLTFHKQITETCKSAFYSIRNIYKIRKFLNLDTAKILVHAFVTSELDHCNSLLYGLPKYEIQRLQHALNSATRLITLSHKFDHITPLPMSLYWLAIVDWTAHRIQASRVGAVFCRKIRICLLGNLLTLAVVNNIECCDLSYMLFGYRRCSRITMRSWRISILMI